MIDFALFTNGNATLVKLTVVPENGNHEVCDEAQCVKGIRKENRQEAVHCEYREENVLEGIGKQEERNV